MDIELESDMNQVWTFTVAQMEQPTCSAWAVSGHDGFGNTLARTEHASAEAALARLMQLMGAPGPVSASSAFVGVALNAEAGEGVSSP